MGNVEEAASLFGSADSGDVFAAALGTGPTTDEHTAGGDSLNSHEAALAADIFAASSDASDIFGFDQETSNDHGVQNSWLSSGTQPEYDYGLIPSTETNSSRQPVVWGDSQHGQSSNYEQSTYVNAPYDQYGTQSQNDISTHAYGSYASYDSTPAPTIPPAVRSYEPPIQSYEHSALSNAPPAHSYVPPTHSYEPPVQSYEPPVQSYNPPAQSYNPPPPSYNPPVQSYDPPAQIMVHSAYDPSHSIAHSHSAVPVSTSSYDPYRPTQVPASTQVISHAQPPHSYINGSSSHTQHVDPPAAAASYRPKTHNAYDPPLPPPKQRRSAFSPPPTHLSYGSHHPYPVVGSPPLNTPPPPTHFPPARAPSVPVPPPANNVVNGNGSYFPSVSSQPSSLPPVGPPRSRGPTPARPPEYIAHARSPNGHIAHNNNTSPHSFNGILPLSPASSKDVLPTPVEIIPEVTGLEESPGPNAFTYSGFGSYEGKQHLPTGLSPSLAGSSWTNQIVNHDEIKPAAVPEATTLLSPPVSPPPQSNVSPVVHDVPKANGGYSSPTKNRSPERARSPGNASVRSSTSSIHKYAVDSAGRTSGRVASSPPRRSTDSYIPSAYEPTALTGVRKDVAPLDATARTASPALSIHSVNGRNMGSSDPYAPPTLRNGPVASDSRARSMSNGSVYSISSITATDHYSPSRFIPPSVPEYGIPPPASTSGSILANTGVYVPPSTVTQEGTTQVVSLAPPAFTPYAPSPSLLGTNDPLGRASARIPVVSFGFGGKLVTCFHGASSLNTGFDVALSSRQSTDIHLRALREIIPESALDISDASYPGPLFSDPGTPTTGLVRTGALSQIKSKKARVAKYLEERAAEISQGLGYFHQGSLESKRADAKHRLVLLLKVMVENDGRLSGSSDIDAAVRAALLPRLDVSKAPAESLKTASDLHTTASDITSVGYAGFSSSLSNPNDATVSISTLRASHLDKIQNLLLRGERRTAYQYALDEKLWAHAMVIASSIDKDSWKEVVSEFVRTELTCKEASSSNGREALRVAYSLFSGQGAASVQELIPPKPLVSNAHTLQAVSSAMSITTPMTSTFSQINANLPIEVLSNWAETAAMMITSPLSQETSAALTALGDQLNANQWVEAAHVCYLLSLQPTHMGGVGSTSRLVLFGSCGPQGSITFYKDPDPTVLTEIVEFALSLTPTAKGQEPFMGLPHLQAYRLIRATMLAEMGHIQLANRYCDAISSSLTRNSPYINITLVEQLQGLSGRLVATPQLDKTGSWIGSKMARPSLDSIGTWLGSRVTKFVAGEGEMSPLPENTATKQPAYTGPFANYSTISTTPSAVPSPQRSTTDLTQLPNSPPMRAGSAMALRSSAATSHIQINRASSAMDYIRPLNRKPSPVPRVSSAGATTTTFPTPPSSFGQAYNGYGQNGYGASSYSSTSASIHEMSNEDTGPSSDVAQSDGPPTAAWWGSDSSAPTPTASSFSHQNSEEESSGFISLMDDPAYAITPKPSDTLKREPSYTSQDDDDDDLGLGNSSRRSKQANGESSQEGETAPAAKTEPAHAAEKPAESKPTASSSGGWLSRLWKRNETVPGPVKANLGEQTSFYYDKDLKRWVNKNAGEEAAQPTASPPPPRAQTASPGHSNPSAPPRMPNGTAVHPPPTRPATANAVNPGNSPPRKASMRVRSNLVPSEGESTSLPVYPAPPITPTTPGLPGGPPSGGRARPQAKRNVRSRYVDVFQQQ